MMLRQHCAIPVQFTHHEKNTTFSLSFLAGSKFPFVNNNMQQQQQQNPMQSNQQWPGMHMGFNQNSNDGGFPHPNNQQQQQQQHKPTGELKLDYTQLNEISEILYSIFVGFGNSFSDWSTLSVDPAIVSFRQFSQFNPQGQQPPQQQQGGNDHFMSQLNQQQQQQGNQQSLVASAHNEGRFFPY